jgi:putative hydrolase of the HAD superfamily
MRGEVTDVFFDLDHTLWDFDRNSALAFGRLFERHGLRISLEAFLEVYEPINFRYWKLYREDRVSKQELRRGRFNEAFAHFNLYFEVEEIDHMANTYIDELPRDNHLLQGAYEILDYLHGRYRLHIITNGFTNVQLKKLLNSRIDPYFKTVTSSEEAGYKKPHPIIFERALKKAKTASSRALMIGDTFEADIQGAEGVGMHTIFYNYRAEEVPSKYRVIHQLEELRAYL